MNPGRADFSWIMQPNGCRGSHDIQYTIIKARHTAHCKGYTMDHRWSTHCWEDVCVFHHPGLFWALPWWRQPQSPDHNIVMVAMQGRTFYIMEPQLAKMINQEDEHEIMENILGEPSSRKNPWCLHLQRCILIRTATHYDAVPGFYDILRHTTVENKLLRCTMRYCEA